MLQRLCLLDDRGIYVRVCMPNAYGQHAPKRIEVAIALIVLDVFAFASDQSDRFLIVHRDRRKKELAMFVYSGFW
ncbi:MAG: hypothetical protein IT172_07035 [Acidobacteria bacterium]|nr:hypothetical protein [Acidobacteriota bacterium]